MSVSGRSVSHQNRPSECAAAAVQIRRLLSNDGHGAARISCVFYGRWPWSKCQVDQPLGGGAIMAAAQLPFFYRGPSRKSQEASDPGKNKFSQVARPPSLSHSSLDGTLCVAESGATGN
eukprot:scaffold40611_cov69-Cyclotella_meneghiniana.AAC.1